MRKDRGQENVTLLEGSPEDVGMRTEWLK